MKPNALTLEEYLLIVMADQNQVRQRITQAWQDPNTDPSIAAYQAIEALIQKHRAIAASVLEDA